LLLQGSLNLVKPSTFVLSGADCSLLGCDFLHLCSSLLSLLDRFWLVFTVLTNYVRIPFLHSQAWRWRKRVLPKCWCLLIFWTLSVCLQAMKDKMNISRGRERDRTARQVRPHRLIGVIIVDWKMGKCKCRRLLMVWHLQDRGGTRLPLAHLFTFDTIFTLGWVQIINIQIKYSQENRRTSVHQNGEW